MRAGAVWIVIGIAVAALLAMMDFDRFFADFHGLFFESGTWQFPSGDLLIQLFPEPFWMSTAVLVAALSLVGAVALTLFSRAIGNDRVHDA
jgi:integral membrane protein (TIGR01906 family)